MKTLLQPTSVTYCPVSGLTSLESKTTPPPTEHCHISQDIGLSPEVSKKSSEKNLARMPTWWGHQSICSNCLCFGGDTRPRQLHHPLRWSQLAMLPLGHKWRCAVLDLVWAFFIKTSVLLLNRAPQSQHFVRAIVLCIVNWYTTFQIHQPVSQLSVFWIAPGNEVRNRKWRRWSNECTALVHLSRDRTFTWAMKKKFWKKTLP